MPLYCYMRDDDGRVVEEFYHRAEDAPEKIVCEDGVIARRDLMAEHTDGRKAVYGKWPLVSVAAGINPKQIKSFQARMGEHHRFDPRTGNAIFESRQHRRKCLQDRGMIDRDSYTGY